jgi:hypothetical protein
MFASSLKAVVHISSLFVLRSCSLLDHVNGLCKNGGMNSASHTDCMSYEVRPKGIVDLHP